MLNVNFLTIELIYSLESEITTKENVEMIRYIWDNDLFKSF